MTRLASVRVATVDIASLACRIACRYDKPIAWAHEHPAFLATRPADVRIDIDYERRQRPLPWIADGVVPDRPEVVVEGRHRRVRTAYYDALVGPGQVHVRMQPGFGVGGLMRTLWALLLSSRDALVVRARRVVRDGGSSLVVPGDGFVAVARRAGGWVSFATPFGVVGPAATSDPAPLRSLCITGHPVARLEVIGQHVCLIDRTADGIQRVLDLGADLVASVPADDRAVGILDG